MEGAVGQNIQVFSTDMALLLAGSVTVQEKVDVRLKSRNAVFNEKWIYEDR